MVHFINACILGITKNFIDGVHEQKLKVSLDYH